MRYYVGCSGWRNVAWRSSFYHAALDTSNYLCYYSGIFDFVEVNLSSSYGDNKIVKGGFGQQLAKNKEKPSGNILDMVKRWAKQTPDDFRFSVRIPFDILFDKSQTSMQPHENGALYSVNQILFGKFLETLAPLKDKVITLTANVPHYLSLAEGRKWLENLLGLCKCHDYSLALQFGNKSWFQDLTYSTLKRHGASIIWPISLSPGYSNQVVISNGLYFRLDTSMKQSNHTDKAFYRNHLAKLLDTIQEKATDERNIDYLIIAVDHPTYANTLQEIAGIPRTENSLKQSSGTFALPGRIESSNALSNERVVMCVDLNAFYPSCEELRNPALRGKPHAVIMTDQKAGEITQGVVSSCSYEAREYGVRSAMALSKAQSLCPELILLPVDIPYYRKVSEQVMSVLEPFGEVLEQASIDEAFLDCTGKVHDTTNSEFLKEFGTAIKHTVKEKCGLLCSVGIAPTKSAAKIASDYEKPDGLTVVNSAELGAFLAPLDVNRVSGIGPKTEKALKDIGITTLGELANADVQKLKARFGKNGQWMWKVANGLDDEPVTPRGDHVSISTETTLESATRNKEEIQVILHRLINEIYERALHYGYSYRTVGVKLVRGDFSIETRETTYPEAHHDKESIESVIDSLLNKFLLSHKESAVRKVGVKLSHLISKDVVATSFRDNASPGYSAVQKSLLDY